MSGLPATTRIEAQEKSNRNRTAANGSFAFGPFELDTRRRVLARRGRIVPLKPKTLDLLVLLVSRAGELIPKDEIRRELWPDVQVEDANLTNAIAALRRALGRKAIRTSPKHGYSFEMRMESRPGLPQDVTDLFEEARSLFPDRSVEAITRAHHLYTACVARAPEFAEGWAWLGRSSRWLAKMNNGGVEGSRAAEEAFRRALALDPNLACAHEFYTALQSDAGQAVEATTRLLKLAERRPGDARAFAALTHSLRYCGLLAESLAAHRRAARICPDAQTSVAFTLFNRCDYAGVVEWYGGPTQTARRGYLDAAAWAALGYEERAAEAAAERLASPSLPPSIRALVAGLLDAIRGDARAVREAAENWGGDDPEGVLYHARHLSRCGEGERCAALLRGMVAGRRYGCSETLRNDPWFAALRSRPEFPALLEEVTEHETRARAAFRLAGGDLIL